MCGQSCVWRIISSLKKRATRRSVALMSLSDSPGRALAVAALELSVLTAALGRRTACRPLAGGSGWLGKAKLNSSILWLAA
jgi:hypothetical protein